MQTLHDLTPLVFESPWLADERRRWERAGPRIRQANAVICVSRSSADQGIRLLGLDPARLHVSHHGVDPAFAPGPAQREGPPYILLVATWGPHKGFAQALAAADAIAEAGFPHRLLISGFQSSWSLDRIGEELARAKHPERVEVLGRVPDLVALYRGATAVLVPSQAEGFGLPALEAMACGVPVLAADATSLPEVVEDAALLVAPGDSRAWAQETLRLLADEKLRADLAARGPMRAQSFTWERAVSQHAELLRSIR